MTTIPAPVGLAARAAWAMKRVPSDEVSLRSRTPADPPAIGRMGGRESLSTHMEASCVGTARPDSLDSNTGHDIVAPAAGAPWHMARREDAMKDGLRFVDC